jgi:predicted nucleic acid-binding protein
MNHFFLDASALAKRYTLEAGSDKVNHLFLSCQHDRFHCLMLGAGEVISVLVRRHNSGLLTQAAFAQALTNIRQEVIDATDFRTVTVDKTTLGASFALIITYSINATDAAVLRITLDLAAGCRLSGDDVVLVASDQRLLKAAQAEGLLTFDPETQSQTDLDNLIGP